MLDVETEIPVGKKTPMNIFDLRTGNQESLDNHMTKSLRIKEYRARSPFNGKRSNLESIGTENFPKKVQSRPGTAAQTMSLAQSHNIKLTPYQRTMERKNILNPGPNKSTNLKNAGGHFNKDYRRLEYYTPAQKECRIFTIGNLWNENLEHDVNGQGTRTKFIENINMIDKQINPPDMLAENTEGYHQRRANIFKAQHP